MEATAAVAAIAVAPSLPIPKTKFSISFPSLLISSTPCSFLRSSPAKQLIYFKARNRRCWSVVQSSSNDNSSSASEDTWLLEPVGDGDSRHIGYRVPLPGAFEIVSDAVTVGRVAEKADIVLPIATVSGIHARLEKKNGVLLVTDLDSTNGTYLDDKKLRPGAVTIVSPGSVIIFGDANLAMFRVSKIKADIKSETLDSKVSVPAEDLDKN